MLYVIVIILLHFLSTVAFAQTDQSLREVKGQVIRSTHMPAVELEFGKDFKYAGGHKFVLYEVANAEQHFFVDAGKDGRIKRMYWVQFEGYLPTNDHSYNYKITKSVNIGGLDFVADAGARNIKENPGRAGGDGVRAREFLATKGYTLASDEVLSQRLVHLIGDKKRDELMIIYLEDMTPLGLTSADVAKGGKAQARWNEISEGLLARAQKDLRIKLKK
ncbi:MAG TPA: hypothetical protein VFZ23_05615 [Pyrinomonadaceae bacterium]